MRDKKKLIPAPPIIRLDGFIKTKLQFNQCFHECGYTDVIFDGEGNIIDVVICYNYRALIPPRLLKGLSCEDLISLWPIHNLQKASNILKSSLLKKEKKYICVKHPFTFGIRHGYTIPIDKETVLARIFKPKFDLLSS